MMDEDSFNKICIKNGLQKVRVSTNLTYITKDMSEGVELKNGIPVMFFMKEGERIYGESYSQEVANIMKEISSSDLISKKQEKLVKQIEDKKTKNKLIVSNFDALSKQYGIPIELGNLFFVKFDEKLYIKNPGLLYLAGKKGYQGMQFKQHYDEKTQEWVCEYQIYPVVDANVIQAIAKLAPDLQKQALETVTRPTVGEGRASKSNVKMSSMHIFLPEMAQTRAQNRALRAYTGYGGASVEELSEFADDPI